jgi:hypothetical protein
VRSAFKVLDSDGSDELTYREFRAAVRSFGFQGDIRTIFDALDQQGEKLLQLKEIAFLDDWEIPLPVSTPGVDAHHEPHKEPEKSKHDNNSLPRIAPNSEEGFQAHSAHFTIDGEVKHADRLIAGFAQLLRSGKKENALAKPFEPRAFAAASVSAGAFRMPENAVTDADLNALFFAATMYASSNLSATVPRNIATAPIANESNSRVPALPPARPCFSRSNTMSHNSSWASLQLERSTSRGGTPDMEQRKLRGDRHGHRSAKKLFPKISCATVMPMREKPPQRFKKGVLCRNDMARNQYRRVIKTKVILGPPGNHTAARTHGRRLPLI